MNTFALKMVELYRADKKITCYIETGPEHGKITELGTDYLVINKVIVRFDKIKLIEG